jgi:hypothetical protein
MDKNSFFVEHDAMVLRERNSATLDRMVKECGWQLTDGPTPGVFANRPKGHRCLWSCAWRSSERTIQPGDIIPVEYLSGIQLLSESLDWIHTAKGNDFARDLALLLCDYFTDDPHTDWGYWLTAQVSRLLRKLRTSSALVDYFWPWSMPDAYAPTGQKIIFNLPKGVRPGWNLLEEV